MKVKIKTWDAMAKEFGVNMYGNIKCEYYFPPEMEEEMPKDRYIEVKIDHSGIYNWNGWAISEDMIEKVNPYIKAMERL